MMKLCILAVAFVMSYVFWILGGTFGLEFFGCFLLSNLGAVLGAWLGWKVARKLDE